MPPTLPRGVVSGSVVLFQDWSLALGLALQGLGLGVTSQGNATGFPQCLCHRPKKFNGRAACCGERGAHYGGRNRARNRCRSSQFYAHIICKSKRARPGGSWHRFCFAGRSRANSGPSKLVQASKQPLMNPFGVWGMKGPHPHVVCLRKRVGPAGHGL